MRNGQLDVVGPRGRIYTLTAGGRGKLLFGCTEWCYELSGDWSPDGSLLALTTSHQRGRASDGIYVVDPATGTYPACRVG